MASKPDLEASITPRIAEAIKSAVEKIGQNEFLKLSEVSEESLEAILNREEGYVPVGLVTIACQINKSNNDPDLFHNSVTECLKGSTIRIPSTQSERPKLPAKPIDRRKFQRMGSSAATGPLYDKKSMRLLGFGVNTISFLILGYFLGGIALSPLIGYPSCIGVGLSPPSLAPCAGSLVGLVISAIGGLAYTYYYFVKKL
jgi:hypothetical protein